MLPRIPIKKETSITTHFISENYKTFLHLNIDTMNDYIAEIYNAISNVTHECRYINVENLFIQSM